jgi:hypothetical protein
LAVVVLLAFPVLASYLVLASLPSLAFAVRVGADFCARTSDLRVVPYFPDDVIVMLAAPAHPSPVLRLCGGACS